MVLIHPRSLIGFITCLLLSVHANPIGVKDDEREERQISWTQGTDGSHTLGLNIPLPGGSVDGSLTTDKNWHLSGGSIGGSIGEGLQGSAHLSYDKHNGIGATLGIGTGVGGYGTDVHVGWTHNGGFTEGVGTKTGPVGYSVDTDGHSLTQSLGLSGGHSSTTPSSGSGFWFGKRFIPYDEIQGLSEREIKELFDRQISFTTGSDGSHTYGVNVPLPGFSLGGSVTTDPTGHLSGGSLSGSIGEGIQGTASVGYSKGSGFQGSAGIGLGAGGNGVDLHLGYSQNGGFSAGTGGHIGAIGGSIDTDGHSYSSSLGLTAGGTSSHTPSTHTSSGFWFGKRFVKYENLSEEEIKELFERQISFTTGSDGSHTYGVNVPLPGFSLGGSVTTDPSGHLSGGSLTGSIGEGIQGTASLGYSKGSGLQGSAGIGLGAGGSGVDLHVGYSQNGGLTAGTGGHIGAIGGSVDTDGHSYSSSLGLTAGGTSSHTPSTHTSSGFWFGKRFVKYEDLSEEEIKELFERQISFTTGSDGSHTYGVNVPLPGFSLGGSVTTDPSGHLSGGSLTGSIGEGIQGTASVGYSKESGFQGSAGIGLGAGGSGVDLHLGYSQNGGFSAGTGGHIGAIGGSIDTDGHSYSSSLGLTAGGTSSHTPSTHTSSGFWFGKRFVKYENLSEEEIKELFERQISFTTGSDGSHTYGVNVPLPGFSLGGSVTTDPTGHLSGGSVTGSIGEGIQGTASVGYSKGSGFQGSAGIGLGAGGSGVDLHLGYSQNGGLTAGTGGHIGAIGGSIDTDGHSYSSSLGLTAGGTSSHTPSTHTSSGFWFGKRFVKYENLSEEEIN